MKKLSLLLIIFLMPIADADSPAVSISAPAMNVPWVVGGSYTYTLTGLMTFPNPVSVSITAPANFLVSSHCPYAPSLNNTCTFTLTPTEKGTFQGSVNVHLNARNSFSPAPTELNVSVLENTIYISNYSNNSITRCKVTASGSLSACRSAGDLSFSQPTAIALNPFNTFAYIGSDGRGLYKCSVNSETGLINAGDCSSATTYNLSRPYSIVFNANRVIAYVSNNDTGKIARCIVFDNNLTCADSGASEIVNPYSIVINPAENLLYVADRAGAVKQCRINQNSTLSNCTNAMNDGYVFAEPTGITLNAAGTYAYITDLSTNKVSECAVDPSGTSSHTLSNCSLTATGGQALDAPVGISLNSAGTMAYITNLNYSTSGAVLACPVKSNHTLGSCSVAGDGFTFDSPFGIFMALG
jgi:hypothetical protein